MRDSIAASVTLPELTLRGCLLASIITILFMASNIYLGLKVGLTFSSAIPAAVISMAILKSFKDSNMLENTMVQTFASSAGTLSSIIFVLPGLVMIGYWKGFPFWETMSICTVGGILGVMFSIPLRRALVVQSDLPYPEGVAAAEILRVGSRENAELMKDKAFRNEPGIKDILAGTLLASLFSLFSHGLRVFSESLSYYTKIGSSVFGIANDYSLALVGAGYLVGIRVGIALLIGTIISWVIAVPWLSSHMTGLEGSAADIANMLWSTKVRFIGVGTIAIAAIWTMVLLIKPICAGITSSFQALSQIRLQGKESIIRTEKDIPINMVIAGTLILVVPLLGIFGYFIYDEHLPISTHEIIILTLLCVGFVLVISFITAAISGYMAGLVGSSNSPISGIGILSIIGASVLMVLAVSPSINSNYTHLTIALSIYMTSVVIAIGCISNDNLQDLKTGHLVGATPWRQQVALIYGVIVGALVIPFLLGLLYDAYGFPGSMPRPGMDPAEALSAPQAVLMSALSKAIITHQLDWQMMLIGISIAVVFLIIDATILKRYNARLSVIAVGIGIYLPISVNVPIILGSLIPFMVERYLTKKAKTAGQDPKQLQQKPQRRGVLLASGLIVGESVVGVIIAFLIVALNNQYPIAIVESHFEYIASWLGGLGFLMVFVFYYYYVTRYKQA